MQWQFNGQGSSPHGPISGQQPRPMHSSLETEDYLPVCCVAPSLFCVAWTLAGSCVLGKESYVTKFNMQLDVDKESATF